MISNKSIHYLILILSINFLFGGSDIIMLFQKDIDLQLDTEHKHHNYGSIIATANTL